MAENSCGSYSWESGFGGNVPDEAVHGGQDCDGSPMFVGRVSYGGEVIPCRICPEHGCAFVGHQGSEIRMECYEVLKSYGVEWISAQGGYVPSNSLVAGRSSEGEILYVGRAEYNGGLFIGKIVPSKAVLYITFEGNEIQLPSYEVLVLN